MNFYFSGSEAIRDGDLRDRVVDVCQCRLQSCHGDYIKQAYKWMNSCVKLGVSNNKKMLLDSGAFTAWSKGHTTTVDELLPVYEDILNMFGDQFEEMWFINLDVIPGSREKLPTQDEIEQALIDSDKNLRILQQYLGDRILPVFHQGEPWDRLDVVQEQSSYICISPRQTVSENHRVQWCGEVSLRIKKDTLMHGLATTGSRSIRVAPWHSVDSASWVITGGLGTILCNINDKLLPISVSQESPNKKDLGKHIDSYPDLMRQRVVEQLEEFNFTIEDASVDPGIRQAFNLFVIQQWVKNVKPLTTNQQGLF